MFYLKHQDTAPGGRPGALCRRAYLGLALVFMGAAPVFAGETEDRIRARIENFLPNMKVLEIQPSRYPELYKVLFANETLYVTRDGRYAFSGDMWDLEKRSNLSELDRQGSRVDALSRLIPEEYIEFAPESGYQNVVHVFTDVDCGYCRKLHQHVQEFNNEGIAVRYLAYPRNGPDSVTAKTMESIWCAADRRNAMTQAKQGLSVDETAACENPVREQFTLGQAIGVRGTPAVILEDGRSFGYLTPEQLLNQLGRPRQQAAQ